MTTFIEELSIRGFKSFHRKTDIALTNKLNCIVGSNGSGKSNILDSLCFVLGRLSTKSIRAENYADLLHKKQGKSVSEGEVSLVLNNEKYVYVNSLLFKILRSFSSLIFSITEPMLSPSA